MSLINDTKKFKTIKQIHNKQKKTKFYNFSKENNFSEDTNLAENLKLFWPKSLKIAYRTGNSLGKHKCQKKINLGFTN